MDREPGELLTGRHFHRSARSIEVRLAFYVVQKSFAQSTRDAWILQTALELSTHHAWTLREHPEVSTSGAWTLREHPELSTSDAWTLCDNSEVSTSGAWKVRDNSKVSTRDAWTLRDRSAHALFTADVVFQRAALRWRMFLSRQGDEIAPRARRNTLRDGKPDNQRTNRERRKLRKRRRTQRALRQVVLGLAAGQNRD